MALKTQETLDADAKKRPRPETDQAKIANQIAEQQVKAVNRQAAALEQANKLYEVQLRAEHPTAFPPAASPASADQPHKGGGTPTTKLSPEDGGRQPSRVWRFMSGLFSGGSEEPVIVPPEPEPWQIEDSQYTPPTSGVGPQVIHIYEDTGNQALPGETRRALPAQTTTRNIQAVSDGGYEILINYLEPDTITHAEGWGFSIYTAGPWYVIWWKGKPFGSYEEAELACTALKI